MKSLTTYTKKHYLHRAYLNGFDACLRNEDCPYCIGTHEWSWWWDGWTEAIAQKD